MFKAAHEASRYLSQANPEIAKHLHTAKVRSGYVKALSRTWSSSPEVAQSILDHTNAVYVRKDTSLRKGADKNKPHILFEVYLDDPLFRAEMNARQEILQLALAEQDIRFDTFRIIPSKLGMRERHPFAGVSIDAPQELASRGVGDKTKVAIQGDQEVKQTFKRALCLAFGERAFAVVDMINKVSLTPGSSKTPEGVRQDYRWYVVRLYSEDARLKRIMAEYDADVVAKARELGLRISAIYVNEATVDMRGRHAYEHVNPLE